MNIHWFLTDLLAVQKPQLLPWPNTQRQSTQRQHCGRKENNWYKRSTCCWTFERTFGKVDNWWRLEIHVRSLRFFSFLSLKGCFKLNLKFCVFFSSPQHWSYWWSLETNRRWSFIQSSWTCPCRRNWERLHCFHSWACLAWNREGHNISWMWRRNLLRDGELFMPKSKLKLSLLSWIKFWTFWEKNCVFCEWNLKLFREFLRIKKKALKWAFTKG